MNTFLRRGEKLRPTPSVAIAPHAGGSLGIVHDGRFGRYTAYANQRLPLLSVHTTEPKARTQSPQTGFSNILFSGPGSVHYIKKRSTKLRHNKSPSRGSLRVRRVLVHITHMLFMHLDSNCHFV